MAKPGLCESCNYFDREELPSLPEYGACHRYPPQYEFTPYAKTKEKQVIARFPSVLPTDWCGEFSTKVE